MSEPYEEPRNVVQICVSAGTAGEADFLYALADDGSMWRLLCRGRQEWERLDDLPWREKPIPVISTRGLHTQTHEVTAPR